MDCSLQQGTDVAARSKRPHLEGNQRKGLLLLMKTLKGRRKIHAGNKKEEKVSK